MNIIFVQFSGCGYLSEALSFNKSSILLTCGLKVSRAFDNIRSNYSKSF